ncbi:MAG: hypothetical protein HQM14_17275 [SAR324 cluster bacterium]|nr:hypothetical protein [SAR324 cluster bacterium]
MTDHQPTYTSAFIAAIQPAFEGNPYFSEFRDNIYWEKFRNLDTPFEKILTETLDKYCKAAKFFEGDLQILFDKSIQSFPSFLFVIAAQLSAVQKHKLFAETIQIVGVACGSLNHFPNQTGIELFVESIDPEANSEKLAEQLFNDDSTQPHLPKVLFDDLSLIGESFKLNQTNNKQTLIEYRYLVSGFIRIFLKYYFDLLAHAQNDEMAEHIDQIFVDFFKYIKKADEKIWPMIPNFNILEVQMNHIVAQNKPPHFFKKRFEYLETCNPLIRKKDDLSDSLLQNQLKQWQVFSTKKLLLFLNTVNFCIGRAYAWFLLLQLHQRNTQHFLTLENHISQYNFGNKYADLLNLTQNFSSPRNKARRQTTQILTEVKTKTENPSQIKHITPKQKKEDPNISLDIRSWGPYLAQFHQQVTMAGVLSEEELPVFFRGFAIAALQMLREKKVTPETSRKFKQTVNNLMEGCIQRSSLGKQEVKVFQKQIGREMMNVRTVDFKKRAEKIDSIGLVLVQAHRKQEEYEQSFRQALPIQLTVNYEAERITFTVEDVLLLPLANRQKERLLEAYVPTLISDITMKAIYNLSLTMPDGPGVTTSIYDIGKYANLKIQKLRALLETSQRLKYFLNKPIVLLKHNKKTLQITIEQFFQFPLSSHEQQPDADRFDQHMQYLKRQKEKNLFPIYAYEILANNLDAIPQVKYSQYFTIFPNNKFQQSKLESIIMLWQTKALEDLIVQE